MTAGGWRCILLAVGVVALCVAFTLILGNQAPAEAAMPLVTDAEGEGFVFRFDPSPSSFVFTFTIPIENANPWDVTVVSGTGYLDVWFTEPGADRIGRLTYTETNDYAFREYTMTSGSRPLNLVSGAGFIWFTGAGGNYIGRLDPTTGQIDEFDVPTADSHPTDLDVASDGSIWFTEMAADQIGHLTVTPTGDYTITEYASPITTAGRGWPNGIVVVGDGIFFAHPRVITDCVTRFTPPDSWVHITGLASGIPDEPYKLAVNSSNKVWGTERAGNAISSFGVGTLPIVNRHSLTPTNSLPTGLAADANDHLWFTQWRAGQIGRFIASAPPQKDYYPLPSPGLTPTGITVDSAGGIWVLASRPYRIHLPVVVESW
jgi:virginiamycin B lyase